jgi:hypothetical protein
VLRWILFLYLRGLVPAFKFKRSSYSVVLEGQFASHIIDNTMPASSQRFEDVEIYASGFSYAYC